MELFIFRFYIYIIFRYFYLFRRRNLQFFFQVKKTHRWNLHKKKKVEKVAIGGVYYMRPTLHIRIQPADNYNLV